MSDIEHVIIVGAGHGGVACANGLRKRGFEGRITLYDEDAVDPYERPPLSKKWLTDGEDKRPLLVSKAILEDRNITFKGGISVASIDREAKTITTDYGDMEPYDALVLAMGGRARIIPMPGHDAPNVYSLRVASDAQKLRDGLASGGHIVVIGAGYIGLEVAASARKLGLDVTIVELAERCMIRTASPELSEHFETYHQEQGVTFIKSVGVNEIITEDGRASAVILSNGETLSCDLVLMAAGGIPELSLAADCDLPCDNGILVDEQSRTADPAIFAIGDCARRPSPYSSELIRIESVHNANEQGAIVAAALTDTKRPKLDAPWFWSDQYDLRLQIAGLNKGGEERIIRQEPDTGAIAIFHYDGEQLSSVEAVNSPKAYMATRKVLGSGQTLDRAMAADPDADLRKAII
ncbi:MAG: NAD(P)/FAD-dependent oxidoreductase [Alphaproteobacteria bacterium]